MQNERDLSMKVEDLRKELAKEKRSKEVLEERFANFKSQIINENDVPSTEKNLGSSLKSYSTSTRKLVKVNGASEQG